MTGALEFTLNGSPVKAEGWSPNTTLLDYLRRTGLTGSKEGCAEGDCGACTVAIVEAEAQGRPTYRAINSCLVPLCLMAGREIVTVEGVATGADGRHNTNEVHSSLHPIQQKMVESHGSQCGYCTPGIVMSLFEGYYRGDLRKADQLDDQLCGNLCRCTGYRPIRDAAIEAFLDKHRRNGKDAFAERLKDAELALGQAEYQFASERFFRPDSLGELFDLLARYPEARLIAGATELGLDISKRFKKFTTLISVEAVPELKTIESTESELHVGAAATLTEIEEKMAGEFPALGRMLRVFGSRQIRNRATMGGNLVTASPIGDSAPVLLALDAHVVLVDRTGERTLPISEFFVAYRKTALRPGEILKTIIVPRAGARPSSGAATLDNARAAANWRTDRQAVISVPEKGHSPRGALVPGLVRKCEWYKVSKRREMDISTVAACFVVDLDTKGVVRHARLAYGGVSAMPVRARQSEDALLGKAWSVETIQKVLPILQKEFTPISDVRGAAEYRRSLIASLFQKFYFEGISRAEKACDPDLFASPPRTHSLFHSRTHPSKHAPPHESANRHVTGEAMYTDDLTAGKPMLEVWPVCGPHARAKILRRDAAPARAMPGIRAVLLAEDVPGLNDVGTKHDEILLPDQQVSYHGQIVALVVGETAAACRAAAERVVVDYEPQAPILNLEQAVAAESFHNQPNFIRRGQVDKALEGAPFTREGTFALGGQEHFYLETQAAWAEPGERGAMLVVSSTQHPSEVQMVVAHVLGQPINQVVVQCPRMGGGFGGKETQAALPAALAALAARHTHQPVRVRFNRDQDMAITGHRHPFLARFKVGFDAQGRLLAARVHLYSDGGWAQDLSQAVTDRALFHLDNSYYIPAVEFRGQVAKTNLSSNTAFRGFGGPQGMLVIEEILDRIARQLGLPTELVRERNLYRGKGASNTTHYGQELGDQRIPLIWRQLKASSKFAARRAEITAWNESHAHRKRGLAITPVKFGISFTLSHLNQAGALVLIYQDGTVQVNHAGTEMGQGVHTNIRTIAAKALGVRLDHVRVMPTSTDKVPNTSATAASCGTDLNGGAVANACEILRERLAPVAAELLGAKTSRPPAPEKLDFADGLVFARSRPRSTVAFAEVVRQALLRRISLSATGYYATPGIHWDRIAGRGKPFHYFAYGAAVSEVEVDGFTGMMRLLRVDILHDAGDSINEGVNRGQIEGGFVQGLGWLTAEELKWDEQGRLLTHSPDTYKIPAVGDIPPVFNVTLLKKATQPGVIHGSKAVGEPPFMLAISVREAIRDAVAAFGPPDGEVPLASPATCEAIYAAIQQRLRRVNESLSPPQERAEEGRPSPVGSP